MKILSRFLVVVVALSFGVVAPAQPPAGKLSWPASKVYVTDLATDVETALSGDKIVGALGCTNGQVPVWSTGNAKWECGAGGGGSQTPWTAPVDADANPLTDASSILFRPLSDTDVARRVWSVPEDTGLSWQGGVQHGAWSAFAALSKDTVLGEGYYNYNTTLSNVSSYFDPAISITNESNYYGSNDTFLNSLYERIFSIESPRSTGVLNTIAGTFVVGDTITVRKAGNGVRVASGILSAFSSPNITVQWIATADPAISPAAGDEFESESTTTVTSRTGTFTNNGSPIWVYSTTSSCNTSPTDGTGAVAILAIIDITAQAGTTADLVIVQGGTEAGTALVSGRCIRQKLSNAYANLGTVTKTATAVINATLTSTSKAYRWMMGTVSEQTLASNYFINTNEDDYDAGIYGLRVTSTRGPNFLGYVNILSGASLTDADTTGYRVFIGQASQPAGVQITGKLKITDAAGGNSHIEGFGTAGNLAYKLPIIGSGPGFPTPIVLLAQNPADGVCATGDMMVAGDAAETGWVKCGGQPVTVAGHAIENEGAAVTPQRATLDFVGAGIDCVDDSTGVQTVCTVGAAAGDVVGPESSTTNGVAIFTDTTGKDLSDSGVVVVPAASTTAAAIRFPEATVNGTEYVELVGTTSVTGNLTINIPRLSKANGTGGGTRGPVVGAVAASTYDTPELLCDKTYNSNQGITQACVAGTAKTISNATPGVVQIIACDATVTTGVYFEVVCNVE